MQTRRNRRPRTARPRTARPCIERPCIERLEGRSLLAVGTTDIGFGQSGSAKADFSDSQTHSTGALSAVLQADGKIVAAGENAIVRYKRNGDLDTTFGSDGRVAPAFSVRAIALQSDGSIVVAGRHTLENAEDFFVARYTVSGQLDVTFGTAGLTTIDFGSSEELVSAVQVDWADRIIIVGTADHQVGVARLSPNGQLDTTFAGDGTLNPRFRFEETGQSVALQENGSILVAGISRDSQGAQDLFALRINPNGTIDNNFGDHGIALINIIGSEDTPELGGAVTIQTDGRIVLSCALGQYYAAVVRLNSDGSLDPTFSQNGMAKYPKNVFEVVKVALFSSGRMFVMTRGSGFRLLADGSLDTSFTSSEYRWMEAMDVLIQPDAKPVIVGSLDNTFTVRRLLVTGANDTSFADEGLAKTPTGPAPEVASESVRLANGKFAIAGTDRVNILVAQFTPDGQPDTAFSNDGKLVIPLPDGYRDPKFVNLSAGPDGKLVLGCLVQSSTDNDYLIIRLNTLGQFDTSFSDDGILIEDLGSRDDFFRDVLVQSDGKLVVSVSPRFETTHLQFLRYNVDGSRDTTWGSGGVAAMASRGTVMNTLVQQADGKILAGGFANSISSAVIIRLLPNGRPDNTLSPISKIITQVVRTTQSLLPLSDGSFYVGGGGGVGIAHYLADGTLDSSFSPPGFGREDITAMIRTADGQLVVTRRSNTGSTVSVLNADGSIDQSFYGDGIWDGPLPGQPRDLGRANAMRPAVSGLHLLPDGRILATGSTYQLTELGEDVDFMAVQFLRTTLRTITTTVGLNAAGQIEIADRWAHNNRWQFSSTPTALVLTELSTEPRVKFTVSGLPQVSGDGTKQISIPWSLMSDTRKQLIVNAADGDDTFTFLNGDFNGPTYGMSLRAGDGIDRLSMANYSIPINWLLSTTSTGSVRPQNRVPMTISGFDYLVGGERADHFRAVYDGSANVILFEGGLSDFDSVELTADQDIFIDRTSLNIGRDQVQRYMFFSIEKFDINTGASDNNIYVSPFNGSLTIRTSAGDDNIEANTSYSFCCINSSVAIYAGDGNDIVRVGEGTSRVYGGSGNDILVTGGKQFFSTAGFADRLYGEAGRDILIGNSGRDFLSGGADDDILIGGHCPIFSDPNQSLLSNAWASIWFSSAAYDDRVQQLSQTGVGRNHTTLVGNVLDDFNSVSTDVDVFYGELGRDWYFASEQKEVLTGFLRDFEEDETVALI